MRARRLSQVIQPTGTSFRARQSVLQWLLCVRRVTP